ncbi:DDB1- and CUL4-associated factor 4 [Phytophthora oleae]|uniref:DDB1- and CUL4-associated factor 4 n=1 Tax=Phytophthora oleae TaxID=2107226 RepID=A0ABD3G6B5_9STRA
MAHGRRKKRRVAATTSQEEEAARQRFLEALEAQRANARNEEAAKPAETQATPAPADPLPGFYYDETKRRYFRFSPASERRQREKLEMQQQKQRIDDRKVDVQLKTRRDHGINGHNWVAYMAQRQRDYTWSARYRDCRDLMPKMLSNFLSSQVVKSQDMEINGRLTALALHPRASNLGALGASSGRLDILGLQRLPPESASGSSSQRALPICNFDIEGVITSLQWRPVQELDILVCQLGSGQRSSPWTSTGRVCYLRVGDQETRGVALMSTARMKRLDFPDPWIAKWDPTDTGKFCVGYGGLEMTAAYVDVVAETSNMLLAPPGKISSAVHAQSFFSTGNVVLNGTKSGGLWGWDIRTPRRIFEWEEEASPARPAGSVLDLHMLSDCRRAVVQRSNGELRVVDLRSSKPVVEFMAGAPKRYLPSLRCAVDNNESVVVAGGDAQRPLAVNSFDLRDGRCVSSVEVQNTPQTLKRSTLVQQVQLKSGHYGSRYENTPEIWAISRNELYVCGGRKDNSDE